MNSLLIDEDNNTQHYESTPANAQQVDDSFPSQDLSKVRKDNNKKDRKAAK